MTGKSKAATAAAAAQGGKATAGKPAVTWTSWVDMPLEEFEARIPQLITLVTNFNAAVAALFPGNVTLTDEQRAHAPRFKMGTEVAPNESEPYGELDVFLAALALADQRPDTFSGLADTDQGNDPDVFETQLVRERIIKLKKLILVARQLAPTVALFNDGPAWLGLQVNDVSRAAYLLAKGLAQTDKKAAPTMARAISYYSNIAKAAAETRARNKAAKAAK